MTKLIGQPEASSAVPTRMDSGSLHLAQLTGYAAGILTTISYLPQVWKTWRTRDTSALSTRMTVLLTIGLSLWIAYGALQRAWPIVIFNSISVVLTGSLLLMKKRFEKVGMKRPPQRRITDNVREFPKRRSAK